jgi:hypothetical protein
MPLNMLRTFLPCAFENAYLLHNFLLQAGKRWMWMYTRLSKVTRFIFDAPQVADFDPLLSETDIRREWRDTKTSIQKAIEQVRRPMFVRTLRLSRKKYMRTCFPHLAPNKLTKYAVIFP